MKVPLNTNTIGAKEWYAVKEVFESGQFTMGQRCLAFEKRFADHIGDGLEGVFVNSGSSANLLALFSLVGPKSDIKPGAEVIVPALTWPTTVWPIIQAGLVPVFVDCDPKTLQASMPNVIEAITGKTAAIMLVHALGNTCDLNLILRTCWDKGITIIEDTCESLGAKYVGRTAGSYGTISTFSFYFSHHMTTVEGGMMVTSDPRLADIARSLRAHGWIRDRSDKVSIQKQHKSIDPRFLFVGPGFNLRPTEIQAAIGLVQMDSLRHSNKRRNQIAKFWCDYLEDLQPAIRPMRITDRCEPAWFGFPVVCESEKMRDALNDHMMKNGVETRPIICGNFALQPAISGYPHRVSGTLTNSTGVMRRGLYWGIDPLMGDGVAGYVGDVVRRFFA